MHIKLAEKIGRAFSILTTSPLQTIRRSVHMLFSGTVLITTGFMTARFSTIKS